MSETEKITPTTLLRNAVAGLAVSFVALSLGAAFGILSGRGAFAGMISAGIISLIASLLGGTRVQCSGPTAPMSVVTAAVIGLAYDRIQAEFPGVQAEHFVNQVILLSGGLMIAMAALRLGRFIALIPNVVISGFMNGIALLVWVSQIKKLFGLGNEVAFAGAIILNTAVAIITLVLIFLYPILVRRVIPDWARYMPPVTLVVLIVVTAAVHLGGIKIATVELPDGLDHLYQLLDLLVAQWPRDWSPALLLKALPFACELAILCYLDTLLTSLVVDKMTGEKTRQDKELVAQGVANATVSFLGGIPGAMATIRSVLVIKEGGTLRIVGIFIGLFVIVEMMLFRELITIIPQAVFAGILFKVGYDVFDSESLTAYWQRFGGRKQTSAFFVTHLEMLLIAGTTLVTLLWSLNAAVGIFTLLFYVFNKFIRPDNPIHDMKPRQNPLPEAPFSEDF